MSNQEREEKRKRKADNKSDKLEMMKTSISIVDGISPQKLYCGTKDQRQTNKKMLTIQKNEIMVGKHRPHSRENIMCNGRRHYLLC